MVRRGWTIILSFFLCILLAACAGATAPSRPLIKQAIAQQLIATQQQLSQQLRLDRPLEVEISRVVVAQQTPLTISDRPAYEVQGTYNATLKLPNQTISRRRSPFQIYLQRQSQDKTWRLARRQPTPDGAWNWVTEPLP
jgi:hypothetical protein